MKTRRDVSSIKLGIGRAVVDIRIFEYEISIRIPMVLFEYRKLFEYSNI